MQQFYSWYSLKKKKSYKMFSQEMLRSKIIHFWERVRFFVWFSLPMICNHFPMQFKSSIQMIWTNIMKSNSAISNKKSLAFLGEWRKIRRSDVHENKFNINNSTRHYSKGHQSNIIKSQVLEYKGTITNSTSKPCSMFKLQ